MNLQDVIDQLESATTYPSRAALHRAIEQTPFAREHGLSAKAIAHRIKRDGLRVATAPAQKVGVRKSGEDSTKRTDLTRGGSSAPPQTQEHRAKRYALPVLAKSVPHKYQNLIEQTERGNKAAAIKLKCLDCCCYQIEEIRHCHIRECSLHHIRPFQKKGKT